MLGRATATIANWRDTQNQLVAAGCAAFNAAAPDRSVPQQTRYHALGRAWETLDALGVVTRMRFDGLGRSVATIAWASRSDVN